MFIQQVILQEQVNIYQYSDKFSHEKKDQHFYKDKRQWSFSPVRVLTFKMKVSLHHCEISSSLWGKSDIRHLLKCRWTCIPYATNFHWRTSKYIYTHVRTYAWEQTKVCAGQWQLQISIIIASAEDLTNKYVSTIYSYYSITTDGWPLSTRFIVGAAESFGTLTVTS